MASTLANEMSLIVDSVIAGNKERAHYNAIALGIKMRIVPPAQIERKQQLSSPMQELHRMLVNDIPYPVYIEQNPDTSDVSIIVAMEDANIEMLAHEKRLINPSTNIFIFWMVGFVTFFTIISLLFMRPQIRAIHRLADAAEIFGRGGEIPPSFRPQGAREVRRAALAFIMMRERIKRQISKRTIMLANISHDLRTPMTRMKLQLALIPDSPEKKELEADLKEMQQMVEGYIDFVRGEGSEQNESVRLSIYLRSIIEGYRLHDISISLDISHDTEISLRPQAFRRCLVNLIDNAIRYSSEIIVAIDNTEDEALITIEDNGPGIPKEKYEEVFKPFYRLDNSRNRETGGTGLGLAIARDIILAHGGDIILSKSEKLGGLKVSILLPI